jgi:hypothetical protein
MIVAEKVEKIATRISLSCPWLKRVGFYGFMFFLIKGIVWLLVPVVFFYLGTS